MNGGNQKTVLVTGATGYTGNHLCQELLNRGYHVKALVWSPHQLKRLQEGLKVEPVFGGLARKENLPLPSISLRLERS